MTKAVPAIQDDLFLGHSLKDTPSFRSDREIMSNPFFTLGKHPRKTGWEKRWREDNGQEVFIRNSPGEDGCPTMWDQDILSYLQTLICERLNRGEPVSKHIQFMNGSANHDRRAVTRGDRPRRSARSLGTVPPIPTGPCRSAAKPRSRPVLAPKLPLAPAGRFLDSRWPRSKRDQS